MIEAATNKITLLQFQNMASHKEIKHFITTRNDGVSDAPYSSLNLGLHVGDDPVRVEHNRFSVAAESEIPPIWFTYANQVHGNHITIINPKMRGMGSNDQRSAIPDTDAMITDAEDVCLMILVADCLPILLYDPVRMAIGAVHAGWRGTVQQIASAAVHAMVDEFGCDPSNIIAGLGPSIGPCCYEVDDKLIALVHDNLGDGLIRYDNPLGRSHFDLWEANRRQLMESGVADANIEVAGICTSCQMDRFFSHRREGITGRFGSAIMIRNETCASCTAIHCNWCNKE